jgi:hypothetical protein
MPTRRLDDRIRHLCAQISEAGRDPDATDEQVEALLNDLLAAIHQKVARLRLIAANKLLQREDADKQDRRKR